MSDTIPDESPQPQTEQHPDRPEGQHPHDGEQPRRRRRRRRRGRGGGHGNPDQQGPSAHHGQGQQHPNASSHPGERGHHRGPGGHPNDRPSPDRREDRNHSGRREHPERSSGGEHPPQGRPPRHRPGAEVENWEEIFAGQTFADLGLRNSVLKGIEAAGFKNPTKIQSDMIPLMNQGRDVLGQSRTGTGKTAAFGLPLFNLAQRDLPFQSLILAPTRELAMQIAAELSDLGKFTPIRVSAVFGGQHVAAQAKQLDKGPEIIVATPGRLMDMVQRGHIHLNNVRFAILDEVDRMLDIGFRDDIKQILGSIRHPHQTVFVSATISDEIERLARSYMKDPVKLVTTGGSLTVSLVEQHYITVEPWDKRSLLLHLLTHEEPDLTVVFCRTKRTVDDLTKYLVHKGIDAHAIHGDMYQGKRNSVMRRLRTGELGVLVASDLASRGLDVEGISHVVNYDLPEDPEIYIHRIGRTARAGRGGVAWSLVTPEQGPLLTQIEKLANTHVPEKMYPEFKAGPVPQSIASQRQRDTKWKEQRSGPPARLAAPVIPAKVTTTVDPAKFPGGIVPTKMPPKRFGGRVKSSRSGAAPAAAPPVEGQPGAPAPAP